MRVSTRMAWLLGFFLVANIYLIPKLDQSPRATDVIGLLLGVMLFIQFIAHGLRSTSISFLTLVAMFPILWFIYALSIDDLLTITRSVRWLIALPWAYVLYYIARDSKGCYAWVQGMCWGIVINLLVLVLQFLGYDSIMQDLGLAAHDERVTSVYGMLRASGMHGIANAAMAVISLIVPLCLFLFYKYGKSMWTMLFSFVILAVATVITLTRSPILVSIVTLLLFLLSNLRIRKMFRLATSLLVLFAVVLATFGPPGGWKRWTDLEGLQTNIEERIYTMTISLELLLEKPLGVGVERAKEFVGATHNAFLQASLEYGLPFGALITFLVIAMALRILGGLHGSFALEGVIALHLTGLFLFEEHLNNPTFIIVTAWVTLSTVEWIHSVLKQYLMEQRKGRWLQHG